MLNPVQVSLLEGVYLCREAAELAASEQQQQQPSVVETAPQPASQQPDTQPGENCTRDTHTGVLCVARTNSVDKL